MDNSNSNNEYDINKPFVIRAENDVEYKMSFKFLTPRLRAKILSNDQKYAKIFRRLAKASKVEESLKASKEFYDAAAELGEYTREEADAYLDDCRVDLDAKNALEIYKLGEEKNRELLNIITIEADGFPTAEAFEYVNVKDVQDAIDFFRKYYKI